MLMQERVSSLSELPAVTRRADLTFKHNLANGRHGWLRLTPAYSVRIVEAILSRAPEESNVLDPFSGTATTALCAAMHGHSAVALDINPFLVWFGEAKVRSYAPETLAQARKLAPRVLALSRDTQTAAAPPPPISNIHRWWDAKRLAYLCRLKGSIDQLCPENGALRDLFLVAFCRRMMALSNASFGHQSMSFKIPDAGPPQLALFPEGDAEELEQGVSEDIEFVLAGASENPLAEASIRLADSRQVPVVFEGGADLLITSPPYPNRMSYIRELRPYMYWLGFLKTAQEAGEHDWSAIGGTWGMATSRVACWVRNSDAYLPPDLLRLMERIRRSDAKSGEILSRYVGKYFEDIWFHLASAVKVMKRGAQMHYIVGNSKFYDVLLPVELFYQDMLRRLGVTSSEVITLRKRNSKKELIEYDVAAVV